MPTLKEEAGLIRSLGTGERMQLSQQRGQEGIDWRNEVGMLVRVGSPAEDTDCDMRVGCPHPHCGPPPAAPGRA
jgi:hypothetical protein